MPAGRELNATNTGHFDCREQMLGGLRRYVVVATVAHAKYLAGFQRGDRIMCLVTSDAGVPIVLETARATLAALTGHRQTAGRRMQRYHFAITAFNYKL